MIGWLFLAAVAAVLGRLAVSYGLGRNPPHGRWWAAGAAGALWAVTAVVLVIRFARGMGAMTHMTDANPWGVWVGFLQAGVALSGGGFVMAATVHIFHIKRFEPILRPVVLLAFLGYVFVALTLFIEVGRPYNLWHPLAMWQHHSIMFEVAWCVTLYLTVLALEFSPAVLERLGYTRAVEALHRAAIPVVILGVILSTLHQSSMGTMFLIVPQKIHPLWSSTLLPVFFLVSSVAVGLCVTVVASFYSARLFEKSLDRWLLADLARAASMVLFLYTALRLVDVSARNAWARFGDPAWLGGVFLLEVGGGALLPAVLLSRRAVRDRPRWTVAACLPVLAGVVLNRLTVSWLAMVPYTGPGYWPHWMEVSVSFALLTGVAAVFGLAVRTLPVFPAANPPAPASGTV
ncbi:MAG TPA: polysulfide reductase NrfD [Elusimicrobiota bacterium]|nr:polysulfide reductase NrfD [Elusimicrobiota bacterium]HNA59690.1 polysulfide reductase NrfD [Elusimicrobiota bacterium]HND63744.1 polysulfide reductase NrfD [Elusimicrobiota bacterium]